MLEAWASGCPVVTVPLDGLAGVVAAGRNALVVEPTELAAGVARVLRDPGLAAQLVTGARADFMARFTVERAAEQLLGVYEWAAGPG